MADLSGNSRSSRASKQEHNGKHAGRRPAIYVRRCDCMVSCISLVALLDMAESRLLQLTLSSKARIRPRIALGKVQLVGAGRSGLSLPVSPKAGMAASVNLRDCCSVPRKVNHGVLFRSGQDFECLSMCPTACHFCIILILNS